MLGEFALKRRRQPVFNEFAQLLQQHARSRGLLRSLPAQRKNLLELIEASTGTTGRPWGFRNRVPGRCRYCQKPSPG